MPLNLGTGPEWVCVGRALVASPVGRLWHLGPLQPDCGRGAGGCNGGPSLARRFATKEAATHAIVATHNSDVNGQTVKCSWGKEAGDPNNQQQPQVSPGEVNKHPSWPEQRNRSSPGVMTVDWGAPLATALSEAGPGVDARRLLSSQNLATQYSYPYQQMGYWYPQAAAGYPQVQGQFMQGVQYPYSQYYGQGFG